ncbi:MAG: ABC transporter permease, partial [Pseudoflavonifractor sp.]
AAFFAGGIWAFIPAYLKSRLSISETITTIMFNYIAIMIVGIMVRGVLQDKTGSLPQTAFVPDEAALPLLASPTRLHLGVVLALLAALGVWFLMKKTTVGFELKIVGSAKRAAFCMGLPVTRSLIFSAILGGGLAGLAGMNEVLGVQHRLLEGVSGGNGYTAVLVALLAHNHPIGVVVVSIALAAVQVGANTMQRQMGIPASIVSLLIGFIVVMILANDFLNIYREHRGKQKCEVV